MGFFSWLTGSKKRKAKRNYKAYKNQAWMQGVGSSYYPPATFIRQTRKNLKKYGESYNRNYSASRKKLTQGERSTY